MARAARLTDLMDWKTGGSMNGMNTELLCKVGEMLERNQQPDDGIDPDEVKKKFDRFVRELAAGRSDEDLTPDEISTLSGMNSRRHNADWLPSDIADSVGLEKRSTYGDAIMQARFWARSHELR
jgi:hypothetical protein